MNHSLRDNTDLIRDIVSQCMTLHNSTIICVLSQASELANGLNKTHGGKVRRRSLSILPPFRNPPPRRGCLDSIQADMIISSFILGGRFNSI